MVWGWGTSEKNARVTAPDKILERATAKGVLGLATSHNLSHLKHHTRDLCEAAILSELQIFTKQESGQEPHGEVPEHSHNAKRQR